jgi:diaminopimelate decarboxylase
MTGGTVIETNGDYDHIEIIVRGTGCEENDTLAIKVKVSPESRSISEGDSVWWQGRKAYWTACNRDGKYNKGTKDVKIQRIGYSYKPAVSIL